jgi:hypothetical protein
VLLVQLLGSSHPVVASRMSHLAAAFLAQSRSPQQEPDQATQPQEKAEPLLHRALCIRVTTHGLQHSDTLTSLQSLAAFLQQQGRIGEAMPLLRRSGVHTSWFTHEWIGC